MKNNFETALTIDPANWMERAVYADWLEENGEYTLALAQRWMVKHKKHPVIRGISTMHNGWGWYYDEYNAHYIIPKSLMVWFDFSKNGLCVYPTRQEAELMLGVALERSLKNVQQD